MSDGYNGGNVSQSSAFELEILTSDLLALFERDGLLCHLQNRTQAETKCSVGTCGGCV